MKSIKISATVLAVNCISKGGNPVVTARLKIDWIGVQDNSNVHYYGSNPPVLGANLPYGDVMIFNSADFAQHGDPGLKAMNLLEGEDVTIVISQADNSDTLCLEYITPESHQIDKLKYLA